MVHTVTLLTRDGCGSCVRVHGQLIPLCAGEGAVLEMVDVDLAADRELALEYGDRLPVVLVDGAEHSCWEVDDDELIATLAEPDRFSGWE
ncbi:glutaredoxin family protein [Rhodococcus sp. IEGM 1408]|uniref:glutaredoxin family protein n=1 Tax=Rhodococcus sp. IEGM 1408 TaxID=3082220 RepID=UPI00295346AC|nr:glutaredoxin family protein [Rhodococcus sp. IEGM 1408]MDV8001542.1 glutaredoxin family protein [Rhodococcus sp. IEGM 1408]